ncbi:K(+)-transporting ATPase subunit C [Flectobacillus major]|uniref:K(+)-transporting ATPase subunit C n=1 Tax=Flectobacillus major TaxID=103 RepID=UPI0003FEA36E|nr:K(+)-transporting ATPase subunit C [Flectobacillus major]
MKTHLFPAFKLTVLCLLLFVVAYPLAILGVAQLAPSQGKVAFIEVDGKIVGAENIGQTFDSDRYFNTRPSAVNYNAAGSGGSNKGPSNPDYLKDVQARIDTFLVHNPTITKANVPSELVTASGSGLDPHISPQGALVQINRIALARRIPTATLVELVKEHTEQPLWGLFGTAKINVLKLNIALDTLH